jgi:hypothetical protein
VPVRVGDWLVVHGRRVDEGIRRGQVVEVPHADGSPPYVVRWVGDEHTSLVFPGPDVSFSSEHDPSERSAH